MPVLHRPPLFCTDSTNGLSGVCACSAVRRGTSGMGVPLPWRGTGRGAAVAPFEVFDADPSRGVQFHNSHDPPTHTHHQGLPSRETGTDGDDVIHTPHHPESSVAPETQPQHRWEQAEDPGMVPGVLDVLTITCGATLVESHEGALPANIQPEYMDLSGVFFSEKARCLPFHHS
ncbi:uncharacterized protein LOC109615634 isoform X2 [Esox lucius]|uniref:uncharacterized protein LOC109615634 isoform X2 n=1 Tax=Esox lucius TaxID=8010 RepID=UPI0014777D3D|nr:uncharacterized protein LOC109615634 isoform X2 [Esox lucius]